MNRQVRGCALAVISIVLSVGIYILTSIYGWGLEVKSWAWVLGGGVFGQLFIRFLISIADDDIKNDPNR